jgi:hypothetical protein
MGSTVNKTSYCSCPWSRCPWVCCPLPPRSPSFAASSTNTVPRSLHRDAIRRYSRGCTRCFGAPNTMTSTAPISAPIVADHVAPSGLVTTSTRSIATPTSRAAARLIPETSTAAIHPPDVVTSPNNAHASARADAPPSTRVVHPRCSPFPGSNVWNTSGTGRTCSAASTTGAILRT